jgi:hypothetical protein
MEAAEHWAGGSVVDDTAADAAAMGIPLPDLPDASAEDFDVWPENWPTVEMFLRVQTQWRTSMGGVIGLDYTALAWVLKLYEIEDQRSLLEDLQVMEAAAMHVMNKQEA